MEYDITLKELGVEHGEWKHQYQYQGFLLFRDAINSGKPYVLQMPTGTGKTAIATAGAHYNKVTYVANRHGLLDQAGEAYGFEVLKGRHTYPCMLPEKVAQFKTRFGREPLASDCHLSNMSECTAACPYVMARNRASHAQKAAITYTMAALSPTFINRGGILVCDEAHNMVEDLMDFAMFEIDTAQLTAHDLPMPPFIEGVGEYNHTKRVFTGAIMNPLQGIKIARWGADCVGILSTVLEANKDSLAMNLQSANRLLRTFERLIANLPATRWFLETGISIIKRFNRHTKQYEDRVGIRLRALSAKTIASRLWENKSASMFMSATIGNHAALMAELGLSDSDYEFASLPHPVPVEARLTNNLNLPRMTHKNLTATPDLYRQQASEIANRFINELPPWYRGAIFASSNYKISKLKEYLPKYLRHHTLWEPPAFAPIGERIQAFMNDPRDGLVWVETIQGAGTGLDGQWDKLMYTITASVNSFNPTDKFVQARRASSSAYMWNRVYSEVEQSQGRRARGEHFDRMPPELMAKFAPENFTNDGYLISHGALADGSTMTNLAQKSYSEAFKESIR